MEKNPLLHQGLKPASVLPLAFQLAALPAALYPPSVPTCRLQRIQLVLKIIAVVVAWRLLVKRVPVAHSLWNLLLSWVLWIFQKIPMLARSS